MGISFKRNEQANQSIFFFAARDLGKSLRVNDSTRHCTKTMNIGIIHSLSNVQLPHM